MPLDHKSPSLWALPAPLLLLVFTSTLPAVLSSEQQWPYNLPPGMKYFPEDEVYVKRGLRVQDQLATKTPIGLRRMSPDPNEMFFLDYWQFQDDDDDDPASDNTLWNRSLPQLFGNTTNDTAILPPLSLHSVGELAHNQGVLGRFQRKSLVLRDFQCPTGTNNCSSIGSPYSCCANGETCIQVTDTGNGNVGCCPSGSTCGDQVGACDSNAGYQSCPNNPGGGCCIPNFDCYSIGCISTSTTTTTTTLPAVTATATTYATTCSTDFISCPQSLGGGCCPNTLTCGTSTSCIGASTSTTTTTASATGAPAVRPTDSMTSSDSNSVAITPSPSTTGALVIGYCPQGYYFCSAYYRPGCCQIGRDCSTTNCPLATSTSILVSNGVTVMVPVGASTGGSSYVTTGIITSAATGPNFAIGGSCVSGWMSCSASLGGGCCPDGFSCGTACTATGLSGTTVVGKVAPNPNSADDSAPKAFGMAIIAIGLAKGWAMVAL